MMIRLLIADDERLERGHAYLPLSDGQRNDGLELPGTLAVDSVVI